MHPAWSAFAVETNSHDFQWGEWDCMLDIGDWLKTVTGIDCVSDYRGKYASADEARALFRRQGGLTRVLRCMGRELGLAETAEPRAGDIGLVKAFGMIIRERRSAVFPMGAIMMPSGRWRIRTLGSGHVTRAFPTLVAWSLPCHP